MGDSGRNGNTPRIARLTIRGRALDRSFLDFAAHRARRFSLAGWAALGDNELTIVVKGQSALIDMMEVACMLGPIEALVDDIERTEQDTLDVGAAEFTLLG